MVTGNRPCTREGCEKPAPSLKCPVCLKNGLPPSFYCSNECFKKDWSTHKQYHAFATMSEHDRTTYINKQGTKGSDLDPRFKGYKFTGPLRGYPITPIRTVPEHIKKPDYAEGGIPHSERTAKANRVMVEHTPEQIKKIRKVCEISRELLDLAGSMIKEGVTGEEVDLKVHEACIERNSYPSPLNYYQFPKSCCVSANEVICHGIPDQRPFENGDIINIDITACHDGVHGDMNETYLVGDVDPDSKHLVKVAYESLQEAISKVKPGMLYRDIGSHISRYVNQHGMSIVKSYCGHGIGELFHCAPNVPHYNKNKAVGVIKPGHIFTIEPMINLGTYHDTIWPDQWTVVTRDGKRSAQFEHQLLVTESGVEVLSKRFDHVKYPSNTYGFWDTA